MRRPQSINQDGSPNYDSSHLVEFDFSLLHFDVGLLGAIGNKYVYSIGTVFFISNEFAVTAWHVIEDLINELQPGGEQAFQERLRRNPNVQAALGFGLEIQLSRKIKGPSVAASVIYISKSPLSDIALLEIHPIRQEGFGNARVPMLHAAPPPVGTPIDAFGIVVDEPRLDFEEGKKASFMCKAWWSHGVIKQHLWKGRGSILAFPVFETNANFLGGMSGGPVVSMSGIVFGMVCFDSGPNIDNIEADPLSYVCSLLPVLCCKCEYDFGVGRGKIQTTVLELAKRGIINMGGIDRVELVWEGIDVIGLNIKPI
ncbi:serine protease [Methylobacterium sp. E-041]|uniref:trypsin-like peptidase domain-containing protein n=1 Tax=Methylobacterium sp. E-041 TaxID=2836573 RepID=UPI001FB974E9|nr:trypsin-like peptidase domain-containing protein [Methylobacterium sp. E-041]MCJ2104715.1 serine protease [Methylobacterium sp. E-041]